VMVRYPQVTREQLSALNYAPVKTPKGADVLLGDIAYLQQVPGVGSLRREQGLRNIYVWGALDKDTVSPGEIVSWVESSLLPELKVQFPGIRTELGGAIEEQTAQFSEQMLFFIAGLLCIYILLAVPLRSYSQPLIVMLMIPLSFTGALWGHYLFGLDLSTMSVFGLIAAAGVVINDALVMTDYINGARANGLTVVQAATDVGKARFRAVLLTSLTTFVGVLPLMFESSLQAKLMVPMAVGLGFAVLYATVVSLLLVPALYLIVEDVKAKIANFQPITRQVPAIGADRTNPE
jgi:multidrug efflux pump subunit AcrB